MSAEAPRQSTAARLAEEMASEATFVDTGRLTLDPSRALQQLNERLLGDPRAYLLRLVEAGVRAGATKIELDTRLARLRVELRREPPLPLLSAPRLEQLLGVLIGVELESEDFERETLVLLAIAINAARRLGAVSFESVGADGGGARLCIDGLTQQRVEPIEGGEPGLRFELRKGSLDHDELELLRDRGRWSPVPIDYEGELLSAGKALRDVEDEEAILGPMGQVLGYAYALPGDAPPVLHLLSGGVEIERVLLDDRIAPPGFHAVMPVGLGRDISRSSFIRGPSFDALVARVEARVPELVVSLDPGGIEREHAASRRRRAALLVAGLAFVGMILASGIDPAAMLMVPIFVIVGGVVLVQLIDPRPTS